MNGILHIEWETGYMDIVKDEFFPTTQTKMNFLLRKVVALDREHCKEIVQDLKSYLQNQIAACNAELKKNPKDKDTIRKKNQYAGNFKCIGAFESKQRW